MFSTIKIHGTRNVRFAKMPFRWDARVESIVPESDRYIQTCLSCPSAIFLPHPRALPERLERSLSVS